MTEYCIHDNGGRPYQVLITDTKIIVNRANGYNCNSDEECSNEQEQYTTILQYNNYKKVFIGKDVRVRGVWCLVYDPKTRMMHGEKVSDEYRRIDGNSILINTTKNKYVYIGSEIYDFETDDEIVDYYSPIGNSDVPYPFAIGTKYTYLMLDHVKILNTYVRNKLEPYVHYYKLSNIVTGLKYIGEHPNDPLSEIDSDDERKYFNIPVCTDEDERKYVAYRSKRFNIDKKYMKQYERYVYFKYNTIMSRM